MFGIDGPSWLNYRWLALGSVIVAYIWKWMPFWTVILLAGRMAIPQELYEAAAVDGATGFRRFVHVTFPLLANLYLICTLLSTIWTLGDFNTVYFVTGGGPALVHARAGDTGHPRRVRGRQSGTGHGRGDVGAASADSPGDRADAQAGATTRCSYERDAVSRRRHGAPVAVTSRQSLS